MNIFLKKISRLAAVVMIAFLSVACEEVIELDLNSANPMVVVEGNININTPAWVKITYSTDYFDAEKPNVEPNATVIITDSDGQSETLEYAEDGLYQGHELLGKANTHYTVTIEIDDLEYEATTTLNAPSEILEVSFEETIMQKPGQDSTSYTISMNFTDDPVAKNYYMIKFNSNGINAVNSYFLVDDISYGNAGLIEYTPLRSNFSANDEVIIELFSIDEDTYIYYSEMNNSNGDSMLSSSTPFTPNSNFGSNVLGYFAAWSRVDFQVTVEKYHKILI